MLKPEFAKFDISHLTEVQRIDLAKHFVQRTRKDIEKDWDAENCFPKRVPSDEHYHLSSAYEKLFQQTYEFCTELVRTSQSLGKRQQRVRYWAALALLRCVMSSPAAAVAALERRDGISAQSEDDMDFSQNVFESSNDQTDDSQPTPPVESAEQSMPEAERRKLRELSRIAASLSLTPNDTKLTECAKLVAGLLRDGYHPIVWCRYIATADYVAEGLQRALIHEFSDLRIVSITGMLSDDERRTKIQELANEKRRVLVATDCLSEGINLQTAFNAALHYDLPWNPNRLEQREGRVDRYGQTLSSTVKTIRYFSPDNPVDGVVIRVLLDKARQIHQALGTHVPVPEQSETVTQAVLQALFFKGRNIQEASSQLELGLELPEVIALHKSWDLDAARERENRTRFAQRSLKPNEVRLELEATDAVLGDPDAVRLFVLNAAQRLGIQITQDRRANIYRMVIGADARATLPASIAASLRTTKGNQWFVSFVSPTPEGAEYLGRNHSFVATVAQFLMEEALTKSAMARASRCGAIRTRAISQLTTLYLLRLRFLIEQPERTPLLAEEVQVIGYRGTVGDPEWLDSDKVLELLESATADANIGNEEKAELFKVALDDFNRLSSSLNKNIEGRAKILAEAHRRIRQAVSMKVRGLIVKPQLPPDLLGVLVLQPFVGKS